MQDKKKGAGSNAAAKRMTMHSDAAEPVGGAAGTPCLEASRDLLPHFLLQLDAPRNELLRRVKALANAEEEAAATAAAGSASGPAPAAGTAGGNGAGAPAAASAASGPKGSGKRVVAKDTSVGGASGGEVSSLPEHSHNSEKDFSRRYDAWRSAAQAEDAADLTARVRLRAAGCRRAGTWVWVKLLER